MSPTPRLRIMILSEGPVVRTIEIRKLFNCLKYLMNYIKYGEQSEPKMYEKLTFLALNLAVYCNFYIFLKMSLKVPQIYRNIQEFR